jgi:hypothetical protein
MEETPLPKVEAIELPIDPPEVEPWGEGQLPVGTVLHRFISEEDEALAAAKPTPFVESANESPDIEKKAKETPYFVEV